MPHPRRGTISGQPAGFFADHEGAIAVNRCRNRRHDRFQIDHARSGAHLFELRLGLRQALAQCVGAEPAGDGVHDPLGPALQFPQASGIYGEYGTTFALIALEVVPKHASSSSS
jgi:hypothetical protein